MCDVPSFDSAGTAQLTEFNILKFQLDDLQRSISERRNMINQLIDQVARSYAEELLSRMAESTPDNSGPRAFCDTRDNHIPPADHTIGVCRQRSEHIAPVVSCDMGEAQHRVFGPGRSSCMRSNVPVSKKCEPRRKKNRKCKHKGKKRVVAPSA